MANRAMEKRKNRNSFGAYFLVGLVIIVIGIIVLIQGQDPKKQLEQYQAQEAELNAQIAQEEARAEENEQLEKYVQTLGYVEQEAQAKLNLVTDDEIIFVRE